MRLKDVLKRLGDHGQELRYKVLPDGTQARYRGPNRRVRKREESLGRGSKIKKLPSPFAKENKKKLRKENKRRRKQARADRGRR